MSNKYISDIQKISRHEMADFRKLNFSQYDKSYHKTMASLNNIRIAELFKFKKNI